MLLSLTANMLLNTMTSHLTKLTQHGPSAIACTQVLQHYYCYQQLSDIYFSFKLACSSDISIHPRHLSVPKVTFHSRFRHYSVHPDDGCGLLPHIVWTFRRFVSLQSAGGRFRFRVPPFGTTYLSTSHLRRHSRFSDNDSRPFCFPVPTKTLSYDSCVTITIHHYCLDTRGPCNN